LTEPSNHEASEQPTNGWRAGFDRQVGIAVHLLRWIVLGAAVGVLAGLSSAAFLEVLNWATRTRLEHGWLLYLLPAAGLVVGLAYADAAGARRRRRAQTNSSP